LLMLVRGRLERGTLGARVGLFVENSPGTSISYIRLQSLPAIHNNNTVNTVCTIKSFGRVRRQKGGNV
jgi:hypothetical protein